jgi:hypothetical protein
MAVEFYVADTQYLREVQEEDADLVRYEDYMRLKKAAVKALEALQWTWGGEPLPTLELEAIDALKRAL